MKQGTSCSYYCESRQSSGYLLITLSPCIKPLNQCLSKFVNNNSGNCCCIRWKHFVGALIFNIRLKTIFVLLDIFNKAIMFLLVLKYRYHCKCPIKVSLVISIALHLKKELKRKILNAILGIYIILYRICCAVNR